jgi:Family of unknown function (DUF6401)
MNNDMRSGEAASPEFFAAAIEPAPATEITARLYLDQIMALIGVDGLVEALSTPGLLAEVDQHAAAVRDSIAAAEKQLEPVALAGYARSVLAAHQRHGRELPAADAIDWAEPGWTVLRLLGVCTLAEETESF